jgi:hypothetical protein
MTQQKAIAKAMIDQMVAKAVEALPFAKALRCHVDALLKAEAAVAGEPTQVSGPPDAHLQTPNMQLARHDAAHIGMTEKMHAYRNVGNHAQANEYHRAAQNHATQAAGLRKQGVELQGGEHEAWTEHYKTNEKQYAGHPGGDATHRMDSHMLAHWGASAKTPQEQQSHQERLQFRFSSAHPAGYGLGTRESGKTEAGIAKLRSASRKEAIQTAPTQVTSAGTPSGLQALGTAPTVRATAPAQAGEKTAATVVERQKPPVAGQRGVATTVGKRSAMKAVCLPEGGEPLGKPLPERGKKEEKQDYIGRILHELKHHGEPRPHKQRVAIALEQARRSRKSIDGHELFIVINPKDSYAHEKVA